MADDKSSLVKALEIEAGQELQADPPGTEEIDVDMFAGAPVLGELMKDGRRRAGPGRPKGSMNKNTKAWATWIIGRYGSPLIGLAEIVATPVADLSYLLKCDRLDAAEFQRKCRKDLSEYVHQKAPTQIEINEQLAGALLIIDKTGQATDRQRNQGLGDIVENQSLSEDDDEGSHS
ncbi:MAG: hypothetical protein OER56_03000 [Hyphomicrobiales bacterium]|nr:hypothetical protein [Hyphomicrobiales bacterium]